MQTPDKWKKLKCLEDSKTYVKNRHFQGEFQNQVIVSWYNRHCNGIYLFFFSLLIFRLFFIKEIEKYKCICFRLFKEKKIFTYRMIWKYFIIKGIFQIYKNF